MILSIEKIINFQAIPPRCVLKLLNISKFKRPLFGCPFFLLVFLFVLSFYPHALTHRHYASTCSVHLRLHSSIVRHLTFVHNSVVLQVSAQRHHLYLPHSIHTFFGSFSFYAHFSVSFFELCHTISAILSVRFHFFHRLRRAAATRSPATLSFPDLFGTSHS